MDITIEKRITSLEDIEAIKILKANYCYLADAGIAGNSTKIDDLIDLFADDCWVNFSEFGEHQGKAAVSLFYKEFVVNTLSYSAHMVANPIIKVDGETATGQWYVFVPCTFRQTGQAAWLQGRYNEEYVKINGQWKWKSITATFDHITPYDEGWVKMRMLG